MPKNVQDICNQMYEEWKSKKKKYISKKKTIHGMDLIEYEKFEVKFTKTHRLKNSSIPYMQIILNSENQQFDKQKLKRKVTFYGDKNTEKRKENHTNILTVYVFSLFCIFQSLSLSKSGVFQFEVVFILRESSCLGHIQI